MSESKPDLCNKEKSTKSEILLSYVTALFERLFMLRWWAKYSQEKLANLSQIWLNSGFESWTNIWNIPSVNISVIFLLENYAIFVNLCF